MSVPAVERFQPDRDDVRAATEAVPRIRGFLARHRSLDQVRLVVDDADREEVLTVPRGAVELLAGILEHMAEGEGVSVIPAHAELTTQQAADILNVSRPFLIGLLESGEIEYRKVGRHRRVRAESLHSYLRDDDRRRGEAADELSALTQEMGTS
jgi:excisionase family DNA binding protein